MNGLLSWVYCAEVLSVLLLIPGGISVNMTTQEDTASSTFQTASQTAPISDASIVMATMAVSQVYSLNRSPSPDPQTTTISPTTTTTTTITSATPNAMFYKKVFMVTGGLMIACTLLLVSTFLLACKVCQLNRRLKMLSSNADLISNSEYWMGTANRNKSRSETEAKETTVVMVDLSQTQEEMNNGTVKEDGGEVNEDEQKGEEKEAGDAAKREEVSAAPATAPENSPSSKPQEEAATS